MTPLQTEHKVGWGLTWIALVLTGMVVAAHLSDSHSPGSGAMQTVSLSATSTNASPINGNPRFSPRQGSSRPFDECGCRSAR